MMEYREYDPHPLLRPYIEAYWSVTHTEGGMPLSNRILPDGCVDLIANLGPAVSSSNENALLQPERVYLIGTMTRFSDTLLQPGARLAGVRFKPGAFPLFSSVSLAGTANYCIEQERNWMDVFAQQDVVAALDRCLLRMLNVTGHRLAPILETVVQHNGNIKISALARAHFITPRQLERYFGQYLGISAKAFAGIVRYRAVLKQIKQRNAAEDFESLALEYGYYDHAHLGNTLKAYTGLTPSQC